MMRIRRSLVCLSLLFTACIKPGWNSISDPEKAFQAIFYMERPISVRILDYGFFEYRTLFLSADKWIWYMKFSADQDFIEKIKRSKFGLQLSQDSTLEPREKIPSSFFPRDLKHHIIMKSEDGKMIFVEDSINHLVYMSDSGYQ